MKDLLKKLNNENYEPLGIAITEGESIGTPEEEYDPSHPPCEETQLGRCRCNKGYTCQKYKKGEIIKII